MNFSPYAPSPDEDRTKRIQQEKNKNKQPQAKNKQTFNYAPVNSSASTYSPYQAGDNRPGLGFPSSSTTLINEGLFSGPSGLGAPSGVPVGTQRVNKYETALPIRVDFEAALTYILGPVTGLLFLILETQNDYVRFHAWQSSLVFLALMLCHFVIMFISSFLSWALFCFDIFLLLWLTYRAYLDGATLERYELPYFGPIASRWVDEE
ncbi:uncharacterized protein BYT42DRAFT_487074 [Radiomyces spectabilis]|uniref:uncharacterized protein n=1 Tax=Radiomyces spectabilis TaxID=64574 RepID=UPI00221E4469|nr:uncharacterized protein BYT42DRAFT_487074 [Radiomyces spectabilis]KAI8393643.1 hypothetical protein BYT42DRAFT_487074 [Radiomyces spectabilis]